MSPQFEWIFTLSSLHAKVFKQIDRQLGVHGITFSEFSIMHQLSSEPERTMRRIDLAEKVGMSASGITRALNPMEKLGLVQKEKNPRDARVSLVKLSDVGLQHYTDAAATVQATVDALLAPLESADTAAFRTMAQKLG